MALLLAVAKVALAATPVLGLVHEVKEELDRVMLHQRAHKMTRFGLEIGHSLWQLGIAIGVSNMIMNVMKMHTIAREMSKQEVFSLFLLLEIEP
jgi:hypothetical protein